MSKINDLLLQLTQHMTLYGYEIKSLSVIEPADIFLTRASDTIIDELVTFYHNGNTQALRPEFTASAVREFNKNKAHSVARWQYAGHIFKEEIKDNNKQIQQRYSIGAELIGNASVDAEAEIIAMAWHGIKKITDKKIQIVIGHAGLQKQLLRYYGLDSRLIRRILSIRSQLDDSVLDSIQFSESNHSKHLDEVSDTTENIAHTMLDSLLDSTQYGKTMGGRTRAEIIQRLKLKQQNTLSKQSFNNALDVLEKWMHIQGDPKQSFSQIQSIIKEDDLISHNLLEEWQSLIEKLIYYGIPENVITLQPDLTKNWDYYTGIVFGLKVEDSDTYLASGGRYNDLAQLLGSDEDVPAVGFAYFMEQLLNITPSIISRHQVVILDDLSTSLSIQLAMELRQRNICVIADDENAEIQLIDSQTLKFDNNTYQADQLDDLISVLTQKA